jgi:DNA primase
MQSRSDEFRTHAAECRELASRIRDRELRRLSLELARQWLELAEDAERQRPHRSLQPSRPAA